MNPHTLIVLLYLLTTVESLSYMCLVWRNSFLYYKNDSLQNGTDDLTIDFYKTPKSGEFGIAFSNDNLQNDLQNFVYFTSTNIYFYSNHSQLNQTFNETYNLDTSLYYKIDNIYYATFKISRNKFESFQYIFFTEMDKTTHLVIGWKISPIYDQSTNFNENWCSPNYLGLPGRFFSTWWFTCLPYVGFGILLIVLCIYYRNEQPLKSRGEIGPIICILGSMINLVTDFTHTTLFSYEQIYYNDCFVSTFILYPTVIAMVPVSLFYYFKFIILVNVNAKKFQMVTSKSNEVLSIFYRILLKTTTIEAVMTLYIFLFSIHFISSLSLYAIFGYNCASNAFPIIKIIYLCLLLPLFIIIIILSVGDIIHNYRLLIKCKLREFYLISDPFYFRLIFLITPIEIIVLSIWISPLKYTATFRNILIEFGFAIAIANNTFLPLLFTMISFNFQKKSTVKNGIESLFKTDEIYMLFLKFSQNEWSMENVLCQKLIFEYKSAKIGRKKIVDDIYHRFLKGEEFELNIRNERLKSLIHEIDQIQNDNYPNHLFDELERDLNLNLTDIFSRFSFTDEYKGYLSKKSTITELADKTTI